MINTPLVSIIMPTFNSSKHCERAIKSILQQTYQNWELLITDDASSDNTVELLNKYTSDQRIHIYTLKTNSGASVARNNSIKHANGEILAFLDSDDMWLEEKLEKQIEIVNKNSKCALFYSDYYLINEENETVSSIKTPKIITYNDLLKTCYIGCLTALVNLNVTNKIYMPNLRKRQDFAYWLQILRKHNYAIGINEPLAKYRISSDSISSNKLKLIKYQWQVYYVCEDLGLFKSLFYMATWAYFGFKKYFRIKYLNINK